MHIKRWGQEPLQRKREIVDYFKKEYSKEIKFIKNNCRE